MLARLVLALILWASATLAEAPRLSLVSATDIPRETSFHGGFSGIEVAPDGLSAMLVSDRGWLFSLDLVRVDGSIRSARATSISWPIPLGDLEGIAIRGDTMYVSTEGPPIVSRIVGANMECLSIHFDFYDFALNRALEALAVDESGALYTSPERPPDPDDTMLPIYRYADGAWSRAREIPFDPVFYATGADFGPDGLFYLLERAVTPVGFRTRIRRFNITDPTSAIETLMTTRAGLHDNLEGISVWTAPDGSLRLTLVSDDNFLRAQRSEVVEYKLVEPLAQPATAD